MDVDNKVYEIMKNIFGHDLSDNRNELTINSIDNWDSINHLNLIVSLEEEFSLVLEEKEIEEAVSFHSICAIISKYI